MSHIREEVGTAGGVSFPYLKGGQGRPLLFLHSLVGEFDWHPFVESLSRDHTVYAPLQPGFEGPDRLGRIDSIDDLVFHYVDLLDALKLDAPIIVGASTGGWLAAELAVHYPSRVERLILIDAAGLYVEGSAREDIFAANFAATRHLLFAGSESAVARNYFPDLPQGEVLDRILNFRQAIARIGWNPYLYNPKLKERLYRITAPTLVIWGEDDRLFGREHGDAFEAGIAGAKIKLVDAAGHLPHLESPEATLHLVGEFLTSR
jgi:pimeloyl-ACP methyl ester carboxylesterase